jgi:class 3 adenylate cyclase
MITPIYTDIIQPMTENVVEDIMVQLLDRESAAIPWIVVLLIVVVVIEVLLWIQLARSVAHIRGTLKLLLHFPPNVLFASPAISKVLGGDFSSLFSDYDSFDDDYFDLIFENLPEPSMYANAQLEIETMNATARDLFEKLDPIGTNMIQFFNSSSFTGGNIEMFRDWEPQNVQTVVFQAPDGSEVHLELTPFAASGRFIVLCHDISSTVRYTAEIAAETTRIGTLLERLLPPPVVRKMRNDDEAVTFSVQMASVLALNIIGFSAWAKSVAPSVAVATLSELFTEFDARVTRLPVLTKIKSFGGEYLVVGGLFSEAFQSSSSAADLVSFGLEAVRILENINAKKGIALKMRGGAHFGGPIIAGVLSLERPVFEIFGSPLTIAAQMERIARPMTVHVSRQLYEFIYSDSRFLTQEVAKEIDGRTVLSYCVTQRK